MGKGEIARYKQFLLFPQCFQKACLPRASKGVIVWEWVNPFTNKPWFLRVCSTGLLKTPWDKEKLLVTSNFSISHSVFYLFGELSAIFFKFKNCCLESPSFLKSLKFVVWEWVKTLIVLNTRNTIQTSLMYQTICMICCIQIIIALDLFFLLIKFFQFLHVSKTNDQSSWVWENVAH